MIPQQVPQGQPGAGQVGPQMPFQMQQMMQPPQPAQTAPTPKIDGAELAQYLDGASDGQLKQLARDPKYMTNAMYGPMINAEWTRRVAARQQAQAQQAAMQLPEDTGIAQLPAENIAHMADGGIVALAGGGDYADYDYAPDEDEDVTDVGEASLQPIPKNTQLERERERLSILQTELSRERDPANVAALQREIAATQRRLDQDAPWGVGRGQPTLATPASTTSAPASAPANPRATAMLSVMDRIDRGESVPADQDPMGYSAMNAQQRAQARAQVQAVPAQPSGNRGSWFGIPTLWGEAEQRQFERSEEALRRNREAQAGLTGPSQPPAPPRFADTPIPMEPQAPKQKPEPDYSYAENAFLGATGRRGFGGTAGEPERERRREERMPPDLKREVLAEAKKAVPASERKGMSDEALMTFFLQLMGGRSRNFLRNVSGAGLAALETERGLRKEEGERRKEAALAKYYEQIGASYSRDPEMVRTWKALGNGNIQLGAQRYSRIMQERSPASSEVAIRDKAADNLAVRLEGNMVEKMRAAKDPTYYQKLFEEELNRLRPAGAAGAAGAGGNIKFLGFE